jgi:hypothetical protein
MSVEIGAEAALFPEKEYINGIFVAVHCSNREKSKSQKFFKLSRSTGIDS